jgi:hypothetical protein
VTDGTEQSRSIRQGPRIYARLMVWGGQFLVVAVSIGLMLGGLIGGFIAGRYVAYRDLPAARALVRQLQSESQKLKGQINDLNVKLTTTESKLKDVQDTLNAIRPSENTYNINPNESLIVAGGHLTIGLIGSPSNESVILNINGKQQSASPGEVIKFAPDASTNCQVTVQSFDMFKAVLNASCATAKPQ